MPSNNDELYIMLNESLKKFDVFFTVKAQGKRVIFTFMPSYEYLRPFLRIFSLIFKLNAQRSSGVRERNASSFSFCSSSKVVFITRGFMIANLSILGKSHLRNFAFNNQFSFGGIFYLLNTDAGCAF